MRGWFLVLLAGCAADGVATPGGQAGDPLFEIGEPGASPPVPGECAHEVALYGMTGSAQPTSIGPLTVDAAGIAICLSLDARDNIWVAHFAAGTDYEDGASSSFALALFEPGGTPLGTGWDVTFGGSPPRSFANLEYGVEKGQVLEAILHVRAKTGTATSTIDLHLFEPYE